MFLWSEGFICYRKISALLPSNGGGGTPKKTSQPSLCHVDLTWPNFKMGREKKKSASGAMFLKSSVTIKLLGIAPKICYQ